MRLMEADLPDLQPVNIGNQHEITIAELVNALAEVAGGAVEVTRRPLPVDDPQRRRPDITRAREWLGWEPATPLSAGLRTTYDWFRGELRAPPADAKSLQGIAAQPKLGVVG